MKQHLESPPQSPVPDESQNEYGLAAWELELLDNLKKIPANESDKEYDKIVDGLTDFIGKLALQQSNDSASDYDYSDKKQDQHDAWKTYKDNVVIDPVSVETLPSPDNIFSRLELDRVVKIAPKLQDQMQESDRKNYLTYLAGNKDSRGTTASYEKYLYEREEVTESEALQELHGFLISVVEDDKINQQIGDKASAMIENLTFIGQKEYFEATKGVATYWKEQLDRHPNMQIYAVAGEIAKSYKDEFKDDAVTKSDEYMLDNILAQFSDEELKKYAGRIVLNEQDVSADKPEDLRVVFIDDWTISGEQLIKARRSFLSKHPGFEKSVEIQLLVASQQRIKNGLEYFEHKSGHQTSIPVKAYYLAHTDGTSWYDTRITGFHSSVDYEFEDTLVKMAAYKRHANQGDPVALPAPANIVRPYRIDNRLPNIDRFKELTKSAQLGS